MDHHVVMLCASGSLPSPREQCEAPLRRVATPGRRVRVAVSLAAVTRTHDDDCSPPRPPLIAPRDETTDAKDAPCGHERPRGGAEDSTARHTTPRGLITCRTFGRRRSHLGRFKRESNVSINYIGALSRTHSENCLSFGSFSNELRLDPV